MSSSRPSLGTNRGIVGRASGIRPPSSSTFGSSTDRFQKAKPHDKENTTVVEQQKKRKLDNMTKPPAAPARATNKSSQQTRLPLGTVVRNSDPSISRASTEEEPPSGSDAPSDTGDPFKKYLDDNMKIHGLELFNKQPAAAPRLPVYWRKGVDEVKKCVEAARDSYAFKLASEAQLAQRVEEMEQQVQEKDRLLEEREQKLNEGNLLLEQKDKLLDEKDRKLEENKQQLEVKDQQLEVKDQQLEVQGQQLRDDHELRRRAENEAEVLKQQVETLRLSEENLKARLHDSDEKLCQVSSEATQFKASCKKLENDYDQLKKAFAELEVTKNALSEDAGRTTKDLIAKGIDLDEKITELGLLREEMRELERARDSVNASLQRANEKLEEMKAKLLSHEKLLEENAKEIVSLNRTVGALTERSTLSEEKLAEKDELLNFQQTILTSLTGRKEEVGEMEVKLKELEGLSQSESDLKAEITRLRRELANREHLLRGRDRQLQDMEREFKALHNRMMMMKGNIRVFCRVRPLSIKEGEKNHSAMAVQIPENNIENQISVPGHEGHFKFDKVFPPQTPQPAVFEDISELVTSALDGYKVCIFAYGQTGSGKTFTMFGDSKNEALRGVIPRSMQQIFRVSSQKSTLGWEYTIQISFLEIHNEAIRDLLKGFRVEEEATSSKPEKGSNPAKRSEPSYNIVHEKDGSTTVVGLKVVTVQSVEEASEVLAYAHKKRSVGKTDMNEESSRSHAVFTLRLNGRNRATGETTRGILNLIDLAGSERLKKSNAKGSTLIESIAINKSLSSLSHVLEARSKGELPRYRDGKLTFLLQRSIEKESRTLMFLNISPDVSSTDETLGSLKFGAMVNSCDLGVAGRDIRSADSDGEEQPRHASSSSSRQGVKRKA